VVAAPAVIYKTIQATFGMTSVLPYYATAIVFFSLAGAVLYALLVSRVGPWLAFTAVLPVLFLGASGEDLMWAFQMGFFGSIAAGLGALLALRQETRRGDLLAAVLLVISLSFSSLGIAFVLGAVVDVAIGPRARLRRAFVPGVGMLLYLLWVVGWGHAAQHHVSVDNLVHLPGYLLDAAGAGLAAFCAQEYNSVSHPGHAPVVFKIVALLLALALVVQGVRRRRISRGLAVALTVVLAFWILAGLDRDADRPPISDRYQYPSVVFILLVAGEALAGISFSRVITIAAVGLAVVAAVAGLRLLERDRETWVGFGEQTRAALAGIEAAGGLARPGFFITAWGVEATVGKYREAVARFGSPAFDEAEVLAGAAAFGAEADNLLVQSTRMRLVPTSADALGIGRAGRCTAIEDTEVGAGTRAPSGRSVLVNRGRHAATIYIARFAPGPALRLGAIRPGARVSIDLAQGDWGGAWRLGTREGFVELCR
jgi:hypothetical protein